MTVVSIIGSVLAIILGVISYVARKNDFKRKQAEQAQKDLKDANKNDDPSSFLDSFGRV